MHGLCGKYGYRKTVSAGPIDAGLHGFLFLIFIHFFRNGIADEPIQALSLAGGKLFYHLALPFLDDHIDPIIGFFIVSGGCFLRVILQIII